MHDNEEKEFDPENSLSLSTPFLYPLDETGSLDIHSQSELLNRLASYVIPSKNPRLTFCCLCYCAGMDVGIILGVENTEIAISKAIGTSKQSFSLECKMVRRQYGLNHSSTIKHNATPDAYQNNAHHIKPQR